MPRVNVYLPAELHEALGELEGLNLSQLLQEAIRGVLGCRHHDLVCRRCAEPVDRWALVDERLGGFYRDLIWALEALVARVGTAEGAARVVKDVAQRWQITKADEIPLPRPSRAERAEARYRAAEEAEAVTELPREADSRRRHPTARATSPATPAAMPAQEDIA